MNLMMNIHVRTCINELEWQINRLEQELDQMGYTATAPPHEQQLEDTSSTTIIANHDPTDDPSDIRFTTKQTRLVISD